MLNTSRTTCSPGSLVMSDTSHSTQSQLYSQPVGVNRILSWKIIFLSILQQSISMQERNLHSTGRRHNKREYEGILMCNLFNIFIEMLQRSRLWIILTLFKLIATFALTGGQLLVHKIKISKENSNQTVVVMVVQVRAELGLGPVIFPQTTCISLHIPSLDFQTQLEKIEWKIIDKSKEN